MRVLATAFPGRGHFHAVAPLALALKARGHEVLVATGPDLIEWVDRCGLDAAAVGLSQDDAVRRAKATTPPGEPYAPTMFTAVAPESVLVDLMPLASRFRPDLVVHEEAEHAGPIVASVLAAPCVTHSWAAPAVPLGARKSTARRLTPMWREHARAPARLTGDLYLDACPPPLQTEDASAIAGRTVVRPVPFEGPPGTVPPGLRSLPRPVAYVGFGTVPDFADPQRLARVATAVAGEVASVILTSGPGPRGPVASHVPANVTVHDYVPLRDVLPWVDLVVSHGGAGTTVATLSAGLPHLVLPQGAPSQGRNAAAIGAAGLGLRLDVDGQGSAAIAHAAARLVAEPEFAARAVAMAATLTALPAPEDVVELLDARYGS